jgi:hypothetical protein
MRGKFVLGLTCFIVLATGVSAQVTGKVQVQPASPYPPVVYHQNDVSATIKLSPDQINRLNKVTEQIQTQHFDNFNKLNKINEADRFAHAQQLYWQYHRDWNKAAQDIFAPDQWTRYQQLQYQHAGFGTFYEPEVQKRLNLTKAQMKNVDEYARWNDQMQQNINKVGALDPKQAAEMHKSYRQQYQEHFNKLLTPEQQKMWSELTGQPYTFQPTFVPSK